MPRVKRGTNRRDRRRKVLKLAKGFRATKSKLYRSAKQASRPFSPTAVGKKRD
jgi:large subunit ribosomal protein L20